MADSTTCFVGQFLPPDQQVSCSSPLGQFNSSTGPFTAWRVDGNTATGYATLNLYGTGDGTYEVDGQGGYSETATFSDPVQLETKPEDVLKVTYNYFSRYSEGGYYGTQGSSGLIIGTGTDAITVFGYEDPSICYYHACTYTKTLPSTFKDFISFGAATLVIQTCDRAYDPSCDTSVYGQNKGTAGSADFITIEQFKADGVTPDDFAPEPGSIGLFACGGMMLMLGFFARRHWA